MGRWCAGIVVLLCLGELFEDSLDATSFIVFGVLDVRALIRGRSSLFIFILSVGDF
jgi:hypothetical protein